MTDRKRKRRREAAPSSGRGHILLLAGCFIYLVGANLLWIARDTRPPFWDMASHQIWALDIYESGLSSTIGPDKFYPPLYHSIVAIFYGQFGRNIDAAQYANLPAILLLFVSTYAIGRRVLSPMTAALAAVLVNFYPYLLWLSRETLIDYWLTALVALSMALLFKTEEFSNRRWSLAFGVACGMGMLTKFTFPFFVGLPFLWAARKNIRNAFAALATASLISALWYLPSIPSLLSILRINARDGQLEGDPSLLSGQALIFYWRALEGYQLFLPLSIAFIAGMIALARRFDYSWVLIVLWLLSGWSALLLFQNKDPRYSAPLLPAVALVTAKAFEKRKGFLVILIPFLLLQHYVVSFGVSRLPERVVLFKGKEGPISWDWNLYTQHYFGLWGAPATEDWPIDRVLDRLKTANGKTVKLGMVPDIPRFDLKAFQWSIVLRKAAVTVDRIIDVKAATTSDCDYMLAPEHGTNTYSGPLTREVSEYLQLLPDRFHLVDSFALPNGDVMRLYEVQRLRTANS